MATDRFDVFFNSRVCEVLPSGPTRHPVNTSHNSYRHDRPMNKTDRSNRMLVFDDALGPGPTRQLCEPSCISNDDELTVKSGFTRHNGCRNPIIIQLLRCQSLPVCHTAISVYGTSRAARRLSSISRVIMCGLTINPVRISS